MVEPGAPCGDAWEALRFDPLGWLLEGERPGLHGRVLVELFGRPESSPAVRRQAGASGAADPVAALLAELRPDGAWANRGAWWTRFRGNGWRLLAAVELGADPHDPRLLAGMRAMLEGAAGTGGFAARRDGPLAAGLSARVAAAALAVGLGRHPRVQEALAWLEEAAPATAGGGWADEVGDEDVVAPTALLAGLAAMPAARGPGLRRRARRALVRVLAGGRRPSLERLGHPGLDRTDLAEMLAALARSGAPWDPRLGTALGRLQELQDAAGRWPRRRSVPRSLPVGEWTPAIGEPSGWVTLRAAAAVLRYAVDAGLPRLFPPKPGG